MKKTVIVAVLLSSVAGLYADRAVVEDFADGGSWRARGGIGMRPGAWFAADYSLTGEPCLTRDDGYSGALDFDFTGPKDNWVGFERNKVYQAASVFADTVEFSADAQGWPAALYFGLEGADRKTYYTSPVMIDQKGWGNYSLQLNEKTVKDFRKLEQPVRLRMVRAVVYKAGKGRILIDDLALSGDISKQQALTIKPLDKQLFTLPGQNVAGTYLIRNGKGTKIEAQVSLAITDYDKNPVGTRTANVTLPPYGAAQVRLDAGKLPEGVYATIATASSGKVSNSFEGWLAVFTPNDKRLNATPMYFGIQDTDVWNGPAENALHLKWLKNLGVDIIRYGITGNRMQPTEEMFCAEALEKQLNPVLDAGIIACLSYTEGTPQWLQNGNFNARRMPDNLEKLAKHGEAIGKFCLKHPQIKYLEWWNEPDLGFLNDSTENYLNAMKTLYTSLKKVNPELKVTTGGVTIIHPKEKKDFSRDVYLKGKGFYDIASFHAHGSLPAYVERNNKVEDYLKQAGVDVPLCNTETGERSGYRTDSIKQQAEVLVKKITFAKSRHTEFYMWFTLQDYWDMDFDADDSFGLVTSDNQPKPSFVAYNALIKALANTTIAATVELDRRLETYHFVDTAGNDVFVCWPKIAGNNFMLTLNSAVPVIYTDMFGAVKSLTPVNGQVSVSATARPFYLHAAKGNVTRGKSLIDAGENVCAAPGATFNLPFTVNNPADEAAEFIVSGNTGDGVKVKAAASTAVKATVPLRIERQNCGSFGTALKVEMITAGGVKKSFTVPVTVNAAFIIAGKDVAPANVVIDDLKNVYEMTYDPAIPRWDGAKDLSCRAWAVRNGQGIEFNFAVTDDKHVAKASGADLWKNDSIQLGLSSLSGNTIEVTIADTPEGGMAWCHIASGTVKTGRWGHPATVKRTDKQTRYQVFVPYEALGLSGKAGEQFRMAFIVNEDDGLGRIRWMEWFDGIGKSKNPELFGWAQLQ